MEPGGKSWTAKLLADPTLCCSKIREEAGELAATWEGGEGTERAASEAADLLYHSLVLLNTQVKPDYAETLLSASTSPVDRLQYTLASCARSGLPMQPFTRLRHAISCDLDSRMISNAEQAHGAASYRTSGRLADADSWARSTHALAASAGRVR